MATFDTSELVPARIIPTSGIGNTAEQERRATSALLAVLRAVREFGRSLTRRLGAPAGDIATYIEVPFKLDGRTVRPDGLIVVTRGSTTWSALVEVKTGREVLKTDQVEAYLDVARQYGISAVLTVSNQLAPDEGTSPVTVDRRKTRNVALSHLSWVDILTMAVMEHDHRGVSDPDQAWILGELIAYLEHPNSGALSFDDMGEHWTAIVQSTRDGTLRTSDRGVDDVVRRWDEFMHYLCLELGRQLGANVRRVTRGAESDAEVRRRNAVRALVDQGSLSGTIRIPNAAGDIDLEADLAKRQLRTSISIGAPGTGRPRTRVNWLLRQLGDATDGVRVDARFAGRRQTTSNLLSALRDDPTLALLDNQTDPRSFDVIAVCDLALGRRPGRNSFIESVRQNVQEFYELVVQDLRPWTPSAPRLAAAEEPVPSTGDAVSPLQRWLRTVAEGNSATA